MGKSKEKTGRPVLEMSTIPGQFCHLFWGWGVGGMNAWLFVMLRDPFVGTRSPDPLRRRLGREGVCVPTLEDGCLMVFNPLNPGDRRLQRWSQKPHRASAWRAERAGRGTRVCHMALCSIPLRVPGAI